VGDLPDCIDTIQRVRKLAEQHVDSLQVLQQRDIQTIFTDAKLLKDHESQWYGFTADRLDNRLKWFQSELIPTVDRDKAMLALLFKKFSVDWDVETRTRISDKGKLHIANIYKVWLAVELSLKDNQSAGPYRVEVVTECKSHLERLEREIENMSYWGRKDWHEWAHIVSDWFERSNSAWSLELPAHHKAPSLSNALQSSPALPQSDSYDMDPEGSCPRTHHGRWYSLLSKEICLVAACLVVATLYSVLTHDIQTGFTIAGVLLTSGNVLLAMSMCKWREVGRQKIALE